jgi:hypothetical protein
VWHLLVAARPRWGEQKRLDFYELESYVNSRSKGLVGWLLKTVQGKI